MIGKEVTYFNQLVKNALKGEQFYLGLGIVSSIDISNYSANVTPNDGNPDFLVKLSVLQQSSSSIVIVPKVGSVCLFGYIDSQNAYIISSSDTENLLFNSESTIFNNGNNDGLINIIELTQKLNNLVSEINTELPKIAAGITAAGGSYTPSLTSNFDKSDYEDTTIKH